MQVRVTKLDTARVTEQVGFGAGPDSTPSQRVRVGETVDASNHGTDYFHKMVITNSTGRSRSGDFFCGFEVNAAVHSRNTQSVIISRFDLVDCGDGFLSQMPEVRCKELRDLLKLRTIGNECMYNSFKLGPNVQMKRIEKFDWAGRGTGGWCHMETRYVRLTIKEGEAHAKDVAVFQNLPQLTTVGDDWLAKCSVSHITIEDLPSLQKVGHRWLASCQGTIKTLTLVDFPRLETIGNDFLCGASIPTVSLDNLPALRAVGDNWLRTFDGSIHLRAFPALKKVGANFMHGLRSGAKHFHFIGSKKKTGEAGAVLEETKTEEESGVTEVELPVP